MRHVTAFDGVSQEATAEELDSPSLKAIPPADPKPPPDVPDLDLGRVHVELRD